MAVAKRQAASLIARKICRIEGDNRRKKFWGMLASVVAGLCWGCSLFGWKSAEGRWWAEPTLRGSIGEAVPTLRG